jgi:hypothetical protein
MSFYDGGRALLVRALPLCLGLSALALPTALQAQIQPPPINTPGDYVGEPLSMSDFIRPAFATNFSTVPKFGTGAVPLGSPPLPLNDKGFQWRSGYVYATPEQGAPVNIPPGDPDPAFSYFPGELNVYPNADAIAATGDSPFSSTKGPHDDGYMSITARVTPPAYLPLLPTGFATNYISGAVNSYPFAQQYGYFEMSAKLPAGAGLWPAFWLLPQDNSWPPEIDVMEVLGNNPTVLYTTVHTVLNNPAPTNVHYAVATKTPDLTKAFHTYGVDWGPFKIRWYFDRKLVFSYPTPSNCNKPFYMIANMTVGGPTSWGGAPTSQTHFPATMQVAYIAAWQRSAYLKYIP